MLLEFRTNLVEKLTENSTFKNQIFQHLKHKRQTSLKGHRWEGGQRRQRVRRRRRMKQRPVSRSDVSLGQVERRQVSLNVEQWQAVVVVAEVSGVEKRLEGLVPLLLAHRAASVVSGVVVVVGFDVDERVGDRRLVIFGFVDALAPDVGVAVSRKRELHFSTEKIQILFRSGFKLLVLKNLTQNLGKLWGWHGCESIRQFQTANIVWVIHPWFNL